jgi:hypothetical protein
MIEGKERVRKGMWRGKWLVGFANDSANWMAAKLLAGSIRRFSGYTANPPAEIYAGTSLQIENRGQFGTYRLP